MEETEIFERFCQNNASDTLRKIFYDLSLKKGNEAINHRRDSCGTVLHGTYQMCRRYHPDATLEELRDLDPEVYSLAMSGLVRANNEFRVLM